jgi:hypothetical protein
MPFHRIAAIVLVLIFTGTPSGSAQLGGPIVDSASSPFPSLVTRGSCDPSGNIDEVPFDAASVPFEDWLKEPKARQIPMDMRVTAPELRMDQQTAVVYEGKIDLKNPKEAPERQVVFFVGVDSAAGQRLTETSVHAVNLPANIEGRVDVSVLGCIYFRPGRYSLWIAAYDESSGKHSVQRQNVRVSEIKNDPLPLLESQSPPARFPDLTPEETDLDKAIPSPLFLPVSNRRPLAIDIISLNPGQRNAIGPLSQMALKDSSISVASLDLEKQKVVYDSRTTGTFDFTEMLKAADRHRQDQSIDVNVLLTPDRVGYLRKFLQERMKSSDGKARVTFVVSSPMDFQRGADTSAIQLDANCECRLFYLQMFPRSGDDLEKVLRSAQSRRLVVNSALEFRKALASIVRDLEAF